MRLDWASQKSNEAPNEYMTVLQGFIEAHPNAL